jgi:hypothetical protein
MLFRPIINSRRLFISVQGRRRRHLHEIRKTDVSLNVADRQQVKEVATYHSNKKCAQNFNCEEGGHCLDLDVDWG